ncbi:beta-mannosidase [Sphingomonas sp. 37zxx]|uniref:beta-mannosidase n=1 Tax=Sphingomonas sp. 37zxx TaxID=1550073 RepID=UPI00053C04FB|nr:glycoside hydrolase family 2 protein [Sphingomonas sp. 37zxx]
MKRAWLATLPLILASTAIAGPRQVVWLHDGWEARIDPAKAEDAAKQPKSAAWQPATVPGHIQLDLVRSGQVPDPFIGTNEAAIQWAGLTNWQYRRTLNVTAAMLKRDRVDLVFDGLDTFATVFVNGERLLEANNAHRRWRVQAKSALRVGDNEILIQFRSPIRELQPMVLALENPLPGEYDSAFGDEPKRRQTSPYIRKPKYQYSWDWAPRIVNQGPWQPVRVEAWDDARIDLLAVDQSAITAVEARVVARLQVDAVRAGTHRAQIRVTGPDGRVVRAEQRFAVEPGRNTVLVPISIAKPQRWQPVGLGEQPLYRVQAELRHGNETIDTAERRTGLRAVELVRQKGSFGFRINGTEIFAKGANLIPFDSFPTRVTDAQMRQVLQSARDANMNMIRVWGGGHYLPDSFYDMADEMGLMIWQDFMFGGAVTPPDADFRDNVRVEAEEQVDRLAPHPSIVLWGGNNEVQSGWENWSDRTAWKRRVGADEQERTGVGMAVLFDRVLRVAAARDSDVPYWPGSPSTDFEGPTDTDADGDRHFWDVWSGSKPVERYLDSCPRFMSEYGFQAMPNMATIAAFGADKLDPEAPAMRAHQKFLAGDGNQRLTLYVDQRVRKAADFADFAYLTQVNQMEAIELAARHHRACRPTTLGSLYWQMNDVWPAISWASVDYFGRWKLLNFAARRFFAPQAIVAERTDKTRITLVSDALTPIAATWRLSVRDMGGAILSQREAAVTLPANGVQHIAELDDAALFGGAPANASYAIAELLVDGRVIDRDLVERLMPREMAYPAPGLSARWDGNRVTVSATQLARAVMLDFGTLDARPSDNGFDLLPGESRTITVTSDQDAAQLAQALTLRSLGQTR